MKIAVLGAGSLGIIIGSLIQKGGYDVDLIDVNQENVDALNQKGATLKGFLDETIPVTAKHPNDLNEAYDFIFLLTKQVFTRDALTSMLPFLHENSVVCTLQNGVPEENVAAVAGSSRTISGAVGFGAAWRGPGVSELTTELGTVKKYGFEVGELDGETTDRIKTVKNVLETIGNCDITDNIQGVKWSKLLMNTTFSGMSAALGCRFGDILKDQEAMNCIANLADETIKVARSEGIRMVKMQGKDFEFFELNHQDEIPEKMPMYLEVWEPHANLKASMLQDLERGKRTEIDYINGHVVQKGKPAGIRTPFNELVCELVHEAEKAPIVPDFKENMAVFRDCLQNMKAHSNEK